MRRSTHNIDSVKHKFLEAILNWQLTFESYTADTLKIHFKTLQELSPFQVLFREGPMATLGGPPVGGPPRGAGALSTDH